MTKAVELAQVASTGVSEAFKNRIINGAMVIDQRNAGAGISGTGGGKYATDRWRCDLDSTPTITIQQSSVAPTGFSNSWFGNITGAATVSAGQANVLLQKIEGFNTADLMYGTANAVTTTLSFWVRSSITGTYGGNYQNQAGNRTYVFQYTINAANTWEYKTVTIPGDTTGTWIGATNGSGLIVNFDLGSGTNFEATANAWNASFRVRSSGNVNLCSQSSATFYITGVQLEVGSSATSFEYRSYGQELALCQRYAYRYVGTGVQTLLVGYGGFFQSAQAECVVTFPVTMRTSPSTSIVNGTNWWRCVSNGTTSNFSTLASTSETPVNVLLYSSGASGTQGLATRIDINNSGVGILFSAEL